MLSFETRLLSSMEKVFPTDAPCAMTQKLTSLKNEMVAFQVAVKPDHIPHYFSRVSVKARVECELPVSISMVNLVPVMLPFYNDEDGHYMKKDPGLYPDPLFTNEQNIFLLPTGRWSSFFFEINTVNAEAKEYPIHIVFEPVVERMAVFAPSYSIDTSLTVYNAALPKQSLIYTCWFHSDCLADYYHVPVFSDEYWEIVKKQAIMAHQYGQNMILVPMFTPPLDTQIGGERTTVQTVGVTVDGPLTQSSSYHFNFDLFDRFIAMAREVGMEYFELSHLFTQWGGNACPKIMATVNGEYKRIFGWNVESTSEEYKAFLNAFLPLLVKHIDALGLRGHAYFHLTDEPHGDHLPMYLRLNNIVKPLIDGYPIMDALSDYDFYYSGVSEVPVVATTALTPFLEGKKPDEFWVYYCCAQGRDNLSNRFIDMPGYRTRVLGLQLYKENCVGFLQWGLNFYNTRASLYLIDPYTVTDGECTWPAGDPFIIYPGKNGDPVASQRLILFNEALQDQRALQFLESLTSREHVEKVIRETAGFDITFNDYPVGEDFQLKLRNKVNTEIEKILG